MNDSDGTFSEATEVTRKCRKCGGPNVTVKSWESSCGGYEDYKYTCSDCGHYWWIDGPDT